MIRSIQERIIIIIISSTIIIIIIIILIVIIIIIIIINIITELIIYLDLQVAPRTQLPALSTAVSQRSA